MEAIARQRRSTFSLVGALFVLSLLALMAFAGSAHAVTPSSTPAVIDVAPSGADFTSISAAVRSTTDVLTKQVKIRVAAGNYRDIIGIGGVFQQTTTITPPGAYNLTIEGGWNSDFTNRDPSRATNIFGIPITSVVSIVDSTVTLDGLTLSHGFELGPNLGEGGGLWLGNSKVTVKNSKIIRAGGVFSGGVTSINSDLTFISSEIAENENGGLFGIAIAPVATDETPVGYGPDIAGGIVVDRGKLTLMDTTVRNNTSWGIAGGIFLWEAQATIKGSRILNNDARSGGFGPGVGGGIYAQFSDVQITNSILAGNYAGMRGGGIFFWKPTDLLLSDSLGVIEPINNRLTITNSTIANNTAAGWFGGQGQGGGVYVGNGGPIRAGSADERDADTAQIPISTTTTVDIKNSIVWGNQSGQSDIAFTREDGVDRANLPAMNFRRSDVVIEPDTFEPFATFGGGPVSDVRISYSDIGVFEDVLLGPVVPESVSIQVSPVPGPVAPSYGPGNISADPKFVNSTDAHFIDARTANYHLMKYSPAIDSAAAMGAPAMDLDGAPRPAGSDFDMGAYEERVNFDIVAPTPRILSPRYSTQHSNQTKFRVIWSAVDPAPSSNNVQYEVWVRRGGTGQYKKWLGWTSSRHSIFNGDRGHTYYFRVRAKDAAGNVSRLTRASMTMVPYDGLSAQLIRAKRGFGLFVGARHNTSYYMDTALTSRNRGDFIRYRFTGRRFSLISTRGPRMSRVKVYVDGTHVKTLDLRASTNQYRKAVWNINFPTDGTHIIKFVNLATPGRPRMDIDGIARQLK